MITKVVDNNIGAVSFNLTKLSKLSEFDEFSIVDILCIVQSVSPIATLNLKDGSTTEKRTLTLIDSSNTSVDLTLWRESCNLIPEHLLNNNLIIAFKGLRISNFKTKSLNYNNSSELYYEQLDRLLPNEYNILANFWNSFQGGNIEINTLSKDNYNTTGKKWKVKNL